MKKLFLLFLLLTTASQAQPDKPLYEAPAGWIHIAQIPENNDFEAVINDTVIFTYRFSPDGGKTWSNRPSTPEADEDHIASEGFYHNTTKIYRLVLRHTPGQGYSNYRLKISYDMGKTFQEEHPIDSESEKVIGNVGIGNFSFHPANPEHIFMTLYAGESNSYARSNDNGKNWYFQYLPPPLWGNGSDFELIFDNKDGNRWYVRSSGLKNTGITKYYQTLDDGKTFEEIPFWPQADRSVEPSYVSIAAPGAFHAYLKKHIPGENYMILRSSEPIGFVDIIPNGDTINRVEVLPTLKPEFKYSDYSKNYLHRIDRQNYIIHDPRNQEYTATISTTECRWLGKLDTVSYVSSSLFQTTNAGKTWNEIYKSSLWPKQLRYDPLKKRLWFLTYDIANFESTGVKSIDLWAQDQGTAVEENFSSVETKIFPQPASANSTLTIELPSNEITSTEIFSSLGEKISSASAEPSGEKFLRVKLPKLASGAYFLRINGKNLSFTKGFVVE